MLGATGVSLLKEEEQRSAIRDTGSLNPSSSLPASQTTASCEALISSWTNRTDSKITRRHLCSLQKGLKDAQIYKIQDFLAKCSDVLGLQAAGGELKVVRQQDESNSVTLCLVESREGHDPLLTARGHTLFF